MNTTRPTNVSMIHDVLFQWVLGLRIRAKSNLLDAHQAAEHVALRMLNLLFGYKLDILRRYGEPPTPAIDLGERKREKARKRICFQVTAQDDHRKIQSCIDSVRQKGYHLKYHRLKFLLLVEEKPDYKKPFEHEGIEFDPQDDILDIAQLIDAAQRNDASKQRALIRLLKDEGLWRWGDSNKAYSLLQRDVAIDETSVPERREIQFYNKGSDRFPVYIGSYLLAQDRSVQTVLYDEIRDDIEPMGKPVCWGDVIKSNFRTNEAFAFESEDRAYYKNTLLERIKGFLERATWPVYVAAAVRIAGGGNKHHCVVQFWMATERFQRIEEARWTHVHLPMGPQREAQKFIHEAYRRRLSQYRRLSP